MIGRVKRVNSSRMPSSSPTIRSSMAINTDWRAQKPTKIVPWRTSDP